MFDKTEGFIISKLFFFNFQLQFPHLPNGSKNTFLRDLYVRAKGFGGSGPHLSPPLLFYFIFLLFFLSPLLQIFVFVWLFQVLVAAHGLFDLCCGMRLLLVKAWEAFTVTCGTSPLARG